MAIDSDRATDDVGPKVPFAECIRKPIHMNGHDLTINEINDFNLTVSEGTKFPANHIQMKMLLVSSLLSLWFIFSPSLPLSPYKYIIYIYCMENVSIIINDERSIKVKAITEVLST